jgi:cellulose biosynthesis protein BcsQ
VALRFLPTKIDERLKVGREILEALRTGLKERVLPPIRTDASLVRAPMLRAPAAFSCPRSRGAKDYARLAEALLSDPPAAPA